MDSLAFQKLNMPAACAATYDKTDLISDLGKGASGGKNDDFQKLLEEKSQERDPLVEDRPQAKAPAKKAEKTEKAPAQKGEDSVKTGKRLQVYLAPVSPEELSQYPASWLPQNLEPGEPIVCIGVTTGENGEQIPILVGANTANKMFGRQIVAPETMNPSDPEADAILEATDPTVEHGPAQMLERLADEVAGVEPEAAKQAQPEKEDDDLDAQLMDVEQAPQRVFHDVKAAPVKVGEVYDTNKAQEPDVAKQVDIGVARALEKGESMVRIQLNPENLGSVTVEISRSAEGIIRVALSAHSDETRSLLERHAGELQGMLASRTQQNVEVDVQRGQESQQNQQQQNYDGRNGHAQDQEQDGQEQQRRQQKHTGGQDFLQQLRLGLIPGDGEF